MTKATVRKRAAAFVSCPKRCVRQTVLLHVLLGQASEAAKLLARAPGLGWSGEEDPDHLLFPLFQRLLGNTARGVLHTLAAGIQERFRRYPAYQRGVAGILGE